MNITTKNQELILLAKKSLEGDQKISQKEYDSLVTVALKGDQQLTKDEQLFISSLDDKKTISKLTVSNFDPKSKNFTFDVSQKDANNPKLTISDKNSTRDVRTISSNQTLSSNLTSGSKALEYVVSHLVPCNKKDSVGDVVTDFFVWLPHSINRVHQGNSQVDPKLDSPPSNVKKPGFHYMDVHLIARIAEAHNTGNCLENSALSAIRLADAGVSPVEIFNTHNHAFTVIGRDPDSNPEDVSTWGPNAVIVDGWNRVCYPAKDINKEMFAGKKPEAVSKFYDVAR